MNNIIKNSAIILSIITALLYTFGYFYYEAYLYELGLDITYLYLDLTQTIFKALEPSVRFMSNATLNFFATIGLLVLYWLISHISFFNKINRLIVKSIARLFIAGHSKYHSMRTKPVLNLDALLKRIYVGHAFNVFVIVMLLALGVFFSKECGRNLGKQTLANFQNNHAPKFRIDNKTIGIIACSDVTQLCGVYNYEQQSIEIDTIAALNGAVLLKDNAKI